MRMKNKILLHCLAFIKNIFLQKYINSNGTITDKGVEFYEKNRAFSYADALFETIKIYRGKACFLEDHYFRLMASMRMFRMEIPMYFTLEFFGKEIEKLTESHDYFREGKVRFTVFRNTTGLYLPDSQEIAYLIVAQKGNFLPYETYKVDLFKDYLIPLCLLSNIKSTSRILNVLSSIFANENQTNQSLLLNQQKRLAEASNGNIFLIKGKEIQTPSLEQGCINGIARKKVMELLKKDADLKVHETSISPFELQGADEVFITNAVTGVQWVTHYRKKAYKTMTAKTIYDKWLAML